MLIGTLGSTLRIGDRVRFVYEGSFGGVRAHFSAQRETGKVFFIRAGLLMSSE